MKKWSFLIIFSLILGNLFFTLPSKAATYNFEKDSGIKQIANKVNFGEEQAPEFYIGLVLNIFFSIIGLIFLILIVLAGVKWMTAQGNTSRVDQAKDTITKAITGLIICIIAYGITYFVLNLVLSPQG